MPALVDNLLRLHAEAQQRAANLMASVEVATPVQQIAAEPFINAAVDAAGYYAGELVQARAQTLSQILGKLKIAVGGAKEEHGRDLPLDWRLADSAMRDLADYDTAGSLAQAA